MEETLKIRLKNEFHLSDEVIQVLSEENVRTEENLKHMTFQDYRECGVPRATARELFALFGVKETKEVQITPQKQNALILNENTVIQGKAPEGSTAKKKHMKKQLGLTIVSYLGCGHCRYDLEEFSQEQDILQEEIQECPNCESLFIEAEKVKCYACSANMPDSGTCARCTSKQSDPEDLKLATISVRKTQNLSGKYAKVQARALLQEPSLKAEILAKGRAEKWIQRYEEQGGLSSSRVDAFRNPRG